MLDATKPTISETEELATRKIPYWPDGHWEQTVATAEVMDRIEAYGPTPHRIVEIAYGASNELIGRMVSHYAKNWNSEPDHIEFDPASDIEDTSGIHPISPCAQGHAGSTTQGQEEAA